MFVYKQLRYTLLDQPSLASKIEWLYVDVDGYKIVNVYQLPPMQLQSLDLPVFHQPCLYAGKFNCCHIDWGCDNNSWDSECLAGWVSINSHAFLYNAKNTASFYSNCWNIGTNSDLTFTCVGPCDLLEKFPRS